MQMLYDSDNYVVVYIDANAAQEGTEAVIGADSRPGFEILDKRTNLELYLDGAWAQAFQNHINAWQENTPTQEEVEDTLNNFAVLAQYPLCMH